MTSKPIPSVALLTLGCKLNQAESDHLAQQFWARGYSLAILPMGADIIVINTCTVTHIADRKARHLIRWAHHRHPQAFLVVTGCYAQRAGPELAQLPGVGLVLGNQEKEHLVERVTALTRGNATQPREPFPIFRTRAMVKVQDGCRQGCSFCIVPRVRGPERSRPPAQVLAEVKEKVALGYGEVVLTGTQLGSYGRDIASSLFYLVQLILGETDLQRLRLSSLHPQALTPALLRLWRDRRLCRHLHLPLQSGSPSVLQRMRRSYTVNDFQRAEAAAREAAPGMAITTDLMVGFPGETQGEFEESWRFAQQLAFSAIHVFPFSPRPGTLAAGMPQRVSPKTVKERSQALHALAQEGARRFQSQFLGHRMAVLWERRRGEVWEGLTDNYLRVFAKSPQTLENRLAPARLISEAPGGLWGELEVVN